jgi:hypothetical protein
MPNHGKVTYVGMDNASGTLTDISAYSRSASPSESIDTAESTNFGQNDKTYVIGQGDETFSVEGTFETAFLTMVRQVKAAQQAGTQPTCTVRFGPAGSGTGKYFSERETLITGINVSSSTGDLVTMTVDFQRTGSTTEGVFP